MGARQGPTPDPSFGSICRSAGSGHAQREEPVDTFYALRPGAPSVYSVMLGLLETLRNLVLSGPEPAPFLVALTRNGRPVITLADADTSRLRHEYGPIEMAFRVSARAIAGGLLLQVEEPTNQTGYVLEQFCRRTTTGTLEALPHSWRHPFPSSASSAIMPKRAFANPGLFDHIR
jgi:hypothetical protein